MSYKLYTGDVPFVEGGGNPNSGEHIRGELLNNPETAGP
jgi:hypothetical protein